MKMKKFIVPAVFLSLLLFACLGCGPKYLTSTISPKWKEAKIKKVAIVPFIAGGADEGQKGLRSAKVAPEGVAQVTALFLHGMEKYGYSMILYDEGTKNLLTPNGSLPPDAVKSLREKTGADAVLTGIVTRYEEREGGPIGVRKPASAGFEVNLISTEDGTVLWKGGYAETQKSLLEDVSLLPDFIKRRGTWLSVEELAKGGAEEVLKTIHSALKPALNNHETEEKGY
ncbi:MAG: hypothetical protein PH343_10790 [Nitrospira sp.]|nr:hypothetical protein [Nitrospira sp.]